MPGRRVWRPRVLWTRRPATQVVPDRREPTRQKLRQAAREAADDADEPICPSCGRPDDVVRWQLRQEVLEE